MSKSSPVIFPTLEEANEAFDIAFRAGAFKTGNVGSLSGVRGWSIFMHERGGVLREEEWAAIKNAN